MKAKDFTEIISKTGKLINKLKSYHKTSVCICSSSKYCDLIAVVKWELEKNGIMATGLHYLPEWYLMNQGLEELHHIAEQENIVHVLDELHLRKIDNYDCVVVVNPNNYIGDRTTIEIDYAKTNAKNVFYWEIN